MQQETQERKDRARSSVDAPPFYGACSAAAPWTDNWTTPCDLPGRGMCIDCLDVFCLDHLARHTTCE